MVLAFFCLNTELCVLKFSANETVFQFGNNVFDGRRRNLFAQAVNGLHTGKVIPDKTGVIYSPAATRFVRDVRISTAFTKMIVNGNVEVVITSDQLHIATIEGWREDISKVSISVTGSVLTIDCDKVSPGTKPFIKIPVGQLTSLEVNANGKIRSDVVLPAHNLELLLNGDCEVAVSATGDILVAAADGYELFYTKKRKLSLSGNSHSSFTN